MNKRILYLILGAGLFGFCFFAVFFFPKDVGPTLPAYWPIENFKLQNQNEKDVTLEDLKGKVWVADFVFTTCGSICPVMTKNMAALQRSYLLEKDVLFVSVSVNPENDTPQVLKAFAQKSGADTKSWHFLTGKRDDIQNLAVKSFKIGDMKEPIFHSDKFVLVDHNGVIRGFYSGVEKKDVDKLFVDMALLLKEKRRSGQSAPRR